MFNYGNPEAARILTVNVPEAEALVVDALEGKLTPEQVQQILGICGISSPEDALQVVRKQRHALVMFLTSSEN